MCVSTYTCVFTSAYNFRLQIFINEKVAGNVYFLNIARWKNTPMERTHAYTHGDTPSLNARKCL